MDLNDNLTLFKIYCKSKFRSKVMETYNKLNRNQKNSDEVNELLITSLPDSISSKFELSGKEIESIYTNSKSLQEYVKKNYSTIIRSAQADLLNPESLKFLISLNPSKINDFFDADQSVTISILKTNNQIKKLNLIDFIFIPKEPGSIFQSLSTNSRNEEGKTNYDIYDSWSSLTKEGQLYKKISNLLSIKDSIPDIYSISNKSNQETEEEAIISQEISFKDMEFRLLRLNLKLMFMFMYTYPNINRLSLSSFSDVYTQLHLKVLDETLQDSLLKTI